MQPPKVSVIVAAYNYEAFLGEAVASVLAQTLTDWECIIVDDGSTDGTPAIGRALAECDPRIRFVQQANGGPSAARNHGIRISSGAYLQFLDADDRLHPEKLALHARFLDEHPDADVVYGLSTYFRTAEPERVLYSLRGQLSEPLMERVSSAAEALEKLQMINIMPILSALVRRTAFDRAGTFNEAMRGPEDWDLWLRFAVAGCEFRHLPSDSLAFIRTHDVSLSRSGERMMRAMIAGARTFSSPHWSKPELPLLYEVAAGVDDVDQGRRRQGARRILRAARNATWPLMRLRWRAYGAAAYVLPRRLFRWFVTRPVPEWTLELVRKLTARRKSTASR